MNEIYFFFFFFVIKTVGEWQVWIWIFSDIMVFSQVSHLTHLFILIGSLIFPGYFFKQMSRKYFQLRELRPEGTYVLYSSKNKKLIKKTWGIGLQKWLKPLLVFKDLTAFIWQTSDRKVTVTSWQPSDCNLPRGIWQLPTDADLHYSDQLY